MEHLIILKPLLVEKLIEDSISFLIFENLTSIRDRDLYASENTIS